MALCINCPKEYYTVATHQYNQLKPICESHFNKLINNLDTLLQAIYKDSTYKVNRSKYKLRGKYN